MGWIERLKERALVAADSIGWGAVTGFHDLARMVEVNRRNTASRALIPKIEPELLQSRPQRSG